MFAPGKCYQKQAVDFITYTCEGVPLLRGVSVGGDRTVGRWQWGWAEWRGRQDWELLTGGRLSQLESQCSAWREAAEASWWSLRVDGHSKTRLFGSDSQTVGKWTIIYCCLLKNWIVCCWFTWVFWGSSWNEQWSYLKLLSSCQGFPGIVKSFYCWQLTDWLM